MTRFCQLVFCGIMFIQIPACSQSNPNESLYYSTLYVGSTACNRIIKSSLSIPDSAGCEFMKWELYCDPISENRGHFRIIINYGISRPNTNGFINGGFKISASGQFINEISTNRIYGSRIIMLDWDGLKSPLKLMVMDENVLHFVSEEDHFLPGNAGWGLALYRAN